MTTTVVMPKQGNTVESCIIIEWHKIVGDQVAAGEVLCTVETDKATMDVESTASGTLLARYFVEGDEVAVMTAIASIGETGESITGPGPDGNDGKGLPEAAWLPGMSPAEKAAPEGQSPVLGTVKSAQDKVAGISPRAKNLAQSQNFTTAGILGSGPDGRILERDILAAIDAASSAVTAQPRLTPVASRMVNQGKFVAPETGSGIGGRITTKDLIPRDSSPETPPETDNIAGKVQETPIRGIRKLIAERMLQSMQTTAQLTLNASADASALLEYRKRMKDSAQTLGLQGVTIGDLVLYAVSRTLVDYPDLNALFDGTTIFSYRHVHLALAVDSPRGLIVPVIRKADTLSLKKISSEAKRLAMACQDGTVAPDELTGGTFTVSNLGAMGIEDFTPILNPPQVGILGVGNINLKPVYVDKEVQFIPHIGLSLTINHQVVDGAPGARFLQTLAKNLADIDLTMAI